MKSYAELIRIEVLEVKIKNFTITKLKEQAASITIEKIEEICRLIPALSNEIKWERGTSKKSKDSVKYEFKNGSSIDILAARQSSRGQRRTGKRKIIGVKRIAVAS